MCTGIFLVSCKSDFSPLAANDQYYFSMVGVVDLHADSQWVRVMPIGDSLIPNSREPLDIEVSLADLKGSERTVLRDSLFRFDGDAYVWNFWGSHNLEPNEGYVVAVEAPDGKKSSVFVSVPSYLPLPEVEYAISSESGMINGYSENPVVVLYISYFIQIACGREMEIRVDLLDQLEHDQDGSYYLDFDNRIPLRYETGLSRNAYRTNGRVVTIVSSKDDWPDFSGLDDYEKMLPEVLNNVENGTGLIAGIARRDIDASVRLPKCERM